jgi:fibronectin-binding autotransporter adhesin
MALTRILNNQVTDSSAGNTYLGINAGSKVQDYSVTAGKLANNLTYASNLTVQGNLDVQGTTTTIDTYNVVIEDPLLLLAKDQTGSPTFDIGYIGERGTSDNIAFAWIEANDEFATIFTNTSVSNTTVNVISYANFHTFDANVAGNLTVGGTTSFGNISVTGQINATGNITGGNLNSNAGITGTTLTTTGTATVGNVSTAGTINATGNITGGNLNSNSTITGTTITTTETGTFGNVSTAGTVNATGNVTGGNLNSNGTITGTTLTTTSTATIGNLSTAGTVSATGNITGGNVTANGNVTATTAVITPLVTTASGDLTLNSASGVLQWDGSGNIVMNNQWINNLGYPSADTDAASKQYVDNMVATGLTYHEAVQATTTANLAVTTGGTITYAQPNGAGNGIGATITTTGSFNLIDTANVQTVGTRILVKNEGNAVLNGVYTWSNATVIVRSTDADEYGVDSAQALSLNSYFFTEGGNVNKGSSYVVAEPTGNITFGTSNIVFDQFSTSQVYSANASAGLLLVGTVFSAKVDNDTTAFDGGGNISVKAGANLVTPNIGAATGTSLNVTGNIDGANIIASANVSGAGAVFTGNVTAANFIGNISGNIDAGGSNTQVQFNDNDILAGSASFTFDKSTNLMTVGNISTGGTVNATGNISGGNLTSNGSATVTTTATVGNLSTAGTVNATGNISGGNLNSNGAATVTGTATLGGLEVSGTGNIVGKTIIGNAALNSANTANAALAVGASTSVLIAVGNTAQRPSTGVTGMLRFNTSLDSLEYYDNDSWTSAGTTFTVIVADSFVGNGVANTFTLSQTSTTAATIVSINGIVQIPTTSYSVSGNVLTFTEAPEVSDVIDARLVTTTTTVTNITNASGNAIVEALDSSATIQITGNLLPAANVTYDLGSNTVRWNDAYFSGTSITLGNVIIKNNTGTTIGFFGPDGTTPATIDSTNIDTTTIANGTSSLAVIASGGNIRANVGGSSIITITSAGIVNNMGNGVGNIGNASGYFNTIFAKATSAQYADLAEMYEADQIIEPGTVVCFGGAKEVTICATDACRKVAGVVSTNPSYIMNAGLTGDHVVAVALTGRVPTRVTGTIRKGDMLVATTNGRARAETDPVTGSIIGKALADFDGADGVIEVVVGRL